MAGGVATLWNWQAAFAVAGLLAFGITLDFANPIGTAGGTTIPSWGWTFALTAAPVALGPVLLAMLKRGTEHKLS